MTTKFLGVFFALVLAFVSMGTPSASALTTGTAYTTANLNLRSCASTGCSVKLTMPYGAKVYINYYAGSGWYKVTYSGVGGFASGSYLRQGSTSTSSGTTSYSSKGQALANTAKSYVGYRYTAYGDTPSEGFSCVGLTEWVYKSNGIWIPDSLGGQASKGWAVSRSNLRPGDLVFFQNTMWAGLSHAGIYVGNGYMVNASSPSQGVRYDNIYSSYYSPRWYTGRRLVN